LCTNYSLIASFFSITKSKALLGAQTNHSFLKFQINLSLGFLAIFMKNIKDSLSGKFLQPDYVLSLNIAKGERV
jgi:hypothetical protein